jgi:hypothetical protein
MYEDEPVGRCHGNACPGFCAAYVNSFIRNPVVLPSEPIFGHPTPRFAIVGQDAVYIRNVENCDA